MPGFLKRASSFLQKVRPRWVAAALGVYWIGLFVATHIPLPEGILVSGSDKLAHFAAYAGLGFLFGWWLLLVFGRNSRSRVLVTAFWVLFCWAILDELLQIPVNRTADIADCVADWIGAAFGLLGVRILQLGSVGKTESFGLPSES